MGAQRLLTESDIAAAGRILAAAPSVRDAKAELRERFPDMRAIVVDAFDMRHEAPALRAGRRSLYLASTDGHCWQVTGDPAAAFAFVITEAASAAAMA